MTRRAGRRGRQIARHHLWASARRNLWVLIGLSTVWVVLGASSVTAIAVAGFTGVAWFVAGAWLCALAVALHRLIESTTPRRHAVGAEAEALTSDELHRLRRQGWRLIDSIELRGFDIDHVAVGPGGLVVLETKWRSDPWPIVDGMPCGADAERAIQQVRMNAWRMGHHVSSVTKVGVEAGAVLVVWGPGRPDTDAPIALGGDAVLVPGRLLRRYLEARPTVLDPAEVARIADALETYTRQRDDFEAERAKAQAARTAVLAGHR